MEVKILNLLFNRFPFVKDYFLYSVNPISESIIEILLYPKVNPNIELKAIVFKGKKTLLAPVLIFEDKVLPLTRSFLIAFMQPSDSLVSVTQKLQSQTEADIRSRISSFKEAMIGSELDIELSIDIPVGAVPVIDFSSKYIGGFIYRGEFISYRGNNGKITHIAVDADSEIQSGFKYIGFFKDFAFGPFEIEKVISQQGKVIYITRPYKQIIVDPFDQNIEFTETKIKLPELKLFLFIPESQTPLLAAYISKDNFVRMTGYLAKNFDIMTVDQFKEFLLKYLDARFVNDLINLLKDNGYLDLTGLLHGLENYPDKISTIQEIRKLADAIDLPEISDLKSALINTNIGNIELLLSNVELLYNTMQFLAEMWLSLKIHDADFELLEKISKTISILDDIVMSLNQLGNQV